MTFAHLLVGAVAVFGIYWTIKYLLLPKPPPPPPVKKQKTTTTVKAVTTETTDTEMTTETTAMTIAQTIAQTMSQNKTVTRPDKTTVTRPDKTTVTTPKNMTEAKTVTTTTRSTKKTTTVAPWCGRATDYRYGRRCYRMFEPRTWLGARSFCEDEGGMLCNAFTRHEESHIKELFHKQPKNSFVLVAVGVRTRHWLNHFYDYDSSGRRIDRTLWHGRKYTTPDHREFNCIGPMRQLSWVPRDFKCHFICEYNYPFPRAP